MRRQTRSRVLGTVLAVIFASSVVLPQSGGLSAAPVPSQIVTGQRAFISNGGEGLEHDVESLLGGPDQPYNQFYREMKRWGRYELVGTPAAADIVLQISMFSTLWPLGDRIAQDIQLRVVISDPKTHTTLWTLTERVNGGFKDLHISLDLDAATTLLMKRLKKLATMPEQMEE